MKAILCNFNLFDLHQPIHLVEEDGEPHLVGVSSLDKLGEDIYAICNKYGVTEVHLFGNADVAKQKIIPEIKLLSYGQQDLTIEVNE